MMESIEFEIEGEFIELFKLLKASGVCSTGGEAKMHIEDGEVRVNGEIETRKRRKVHSGDDVEIFDTHLNVI
jgi:ribosome-associated protein